jgi:hypothetical protein
MTLNDEGQWVAILVMARGAAVWVIEHMGIGNLFLNAFINVVIFICNFC